MDEKTQPTQPQEDFEKMGRRYFRNIANWKHVLSDELRGINNRLDMFEIKMAELLETTKKVGHSCGLAFKQVKLIVQELSEVTEQTRQDLSEYGGTMCDSTWLDGPKTIVV